MHVHKVRKHKARTTCLAECFKQMYVCSQMLRPSGLVTRNPIIWLVLFGCENTPHTEPLSIDIITGDASLRDTAEFVSKSFPSTLDPDNVIPKGN